MSKENFKDFARLHPELANFVNRNETSWQKLYELYDIYGENSSVWSSYLIKQGTIEGEKPLKEATVTDVINTIKNVDLKTVQKGISSIQKTIGLLQDMGIGKAETVPPTYEPRPMYKYFED